MAISLKRATLNDSDLVAKIEKIADSMTYHAVTKKKEVLDYIKNNQVFLVKNNAKIIGLVSFNVKGKVAGCNGLVICPNFRRKGYAKKAMALALKALNDYQRIDLVVHPQNSPAVSLYLSLGFEIEKWKNNYFNDGEPRIIMVLVDRKKR